jgi:hypothetical protein
MFQKDSDKFNVHSRKSSEKMNSGGARYHSVQDLVLHETKDYTQNYNFTCYFYECETSSLA